MSRRGMNAPRPAGALLDRTAAMQRAAAIVPFHFHNHPYRATPRRASTTSP